MHASEVIHGRLVHGLTVQIRVMKLVQVISVLCRRWNIFECSLGSGAAGIPFTDRIL